MHKLNYLFCTLHRRIHLRFCRSFTLDGEELLPSGFESQWKSLSVIHKLEKQFTTQLQHMQFQHSILSCTCGHWLPSSESEGPLSQKKIICTNFIPIGEFAFWLFLMKCSNRGISSVIQYGTQVNSLFSFFARHEWVLVFYMPYL